MAAAVLALLLGAGVYAFGHFFTRPAPAPAASGSRCDGNFRHCRNAVATSGDPEQLGDYLARAIRMPAPSPRWRASKIRGRLWKQAAVVPKPARPPQRYPHLSRRRQHLFQARLAGGRAQTGAWCPQPLSPFLRPTGRQHGGTRPAEPAGGGRRIQGRGDAHFGGPPFAYYHTSLTRVSLAIELDDSGKIANASAQAMMTETSSDQRPSAAHRAQPAQFHHERRAARPGRRSGSSFGGGFGKPASHQGNLSRPDLGGRHHRDAGGGQKRCRRRDAAGAVRLISIPMTLTR